MKAVLMAGGEGSRLRPLTVGRPKPMVPIVNKAAMAHILDLLRSHGFTEVIITVRYLASAIQDFFEDGRNLGMRLTYVVEELPLGTAGSVRNAAHYLDDTFLVLSGDALTDFDLRAIVEAHKAHGSPASIALTRVRNPLEYGVIVTDEEEHVVQFLEKPSWGEVVSDTVNTGIYVLEPEVLDMIPPDSAYDFSTELFPRMLAEKQTICGHVAEGYWCDVGNMEEYRQANSDLLYGKVRLAEPIGRDVGGGIWLGEDVEISPSAQLFGPIYLGDGVKIKGDVTIHGPTVIRDYTVIDNYTRVERSILWRNGYVGENCEVRGAIVGRQCSVKSHVVLFEGAVVGDNCVVGEGSVIHSDVKLWPRKEVEPGTTVKESIIWGNQGRRALFGRFGVTGVVNVDLTPEFAAKLGTALGGTLPTNSYVAINRDIHRSSRMLKRALISGIPGAGINVWDLGSVAIPVARYFVRKNEDTVAGIHVRLSPFDQRVVDIRFIDAKGMNQSKSAERAIERTFFREDFRRAYMSEIGTIDYAVRPVEQYTEDFLAQIDTDMIRKARFRAVIDFSHGLAADVLAEILNKVGVEVVTLNARMDETKLAMLQNDFRANLERVSKIVSALDADLGMQFDVGGEKLFLVDENGTILDDVTVAALMVEMALYACPGRPVAVPVTLPNGFDTIAGWHQSRLLRTGNSLHHLMHTADNNELLLAADGAGSFIFPDFHPAVDGMMAAVRLLQYLAHRKLSLSKVADYLPKSHVATERVTCPWEAKGRVMRCLHDQFGAHAHEGIDGFRIHLGGSEWVFLGPDSEAPYFTVVAEADRDERAAELVREYCKRIEQFMPREQV